MGCIIRKCIYLILYNFAKKKKQKNSRSSSRPQKNLETGHFMLLICTERLRKVQKCLMHVQIRCPTNLSLLLGDVLVAITVVFARKFLVY